MENQLKSSDVIDNNGIGYLLEGDWNSKDGQVFREKAFLKSFDLLLDQKTINQYVDIYEKLCNGRCIYIPILLDKDISNGCTSLIFEHRKILRQQDAIELIGGNFKEIVKLAIGITKAVKHVHTMGYCLGGIDSKDFIIERDTLLPILFNLESARALKKPNDGKYNKSAVENIDYTLERLREDVSGIGEIICKFIGVDIHGGGVIDWNKTSGKLKKQLNKLGLSQNRNFEFIKFISRLITPHNEQRIERASDILDELYPFCQDGETASKTSDEKKCFRIKPAKTKEIFRSAINKDVILNKIINTTREIKNGNSNIIFVDGGKGSGKSFILKYIAEKINYKQDIYKCSNEINYKYKSVCGFLDNSISLIINNDNEKSEQLAEKIKSWFSNDELSDILLSKIPSLRHFYKTVQHPKKTVKDITNVELAKIAKAILDTKENNVLLIDDVHNADYHSIDFIDYLFKEEIISSCTIILTVNSEEDLKQHNGFDMLYRSSFGNSNIVTDRVYIGGLNSSHIESFIKEHLPHENKTKEISQKIYDCMADSSSKYFFEILDIGLVNDLIRDAGDGTYIWDINPILARYINSPEASANTIAPYEQSEDLWEILSVASCFIEGFSQKQIIEVLIGQREENYGLQLKIVKYLNDFVEANVLFCSDNYYEFQADHIKQYITDKIPKNKHSKFCWEIVKIMMLTGEADSNLKIATYLSSVSNQNLYGSSDLHFKLVSILEDAAETSWLQHQYEPAISYLEKAVDISNFTLKTAESLNSIPKNYRFELHLKIARACLQKAAIDKGIKQTEIIIVNCSCTILIVKALIIRMQLEKALDRNLDAIGLGKQALSLLSRPIGKVSTRVSCWYFLSKAYQIKSGLKKSRISELPETNSLHIKLYYEVCFNIASAAYLTSDLPLYIYMISKPIVVARKEGVSKELIPILAFFGGTLKIIKNSLPVKITEYHRDLIIKEAISLVERFGAEDYRSYVSYFENAMLIPWSKGTKVTEDPLVQSYKKSLNDEHIELAGWCSGQYFLHRFLSGEEIDILKLRMEQTYPQLKKVRPGGPLIIHRIIQQCVTNLVDKVKSPASISGNIFNIKSLGENIDKLDDVLLRSSLIYSSCFLSLLFHEYDKGKESFKKFKLHNNGILGLVAIPYLITYGLVCTMAANHNSNKLKRVWISKVVQLKMKTTFLAWSKSNTFNFLATWIEAEQFFLRKKPEGEFIFLKAIQEAQAHKNTKVSAIICERLALFTKHVLKDANKTRNHLESSLAQYKKAGCHAKIPLLNTEIRSLKSNTDEDVDNDLFQLVGEAGLTINFCKNRNDIIIKAAEEINRITEAYHSVIIERINDDFLVAAMGYYGEDIASGHLPLKGSSYVCHEIINECIRKKKHISVNLNSTLQVESEINEYLKRNRLNSINCFPVMRGNTIEAIICCEFDAVIHIEDETLNKALNLFSNYVAQALGNLNKKGTNFGSERIIESSKSVLALVNHELKTPLHVALNKIEELKASSDPKSLAEDVRKQLQKLSQYISDITDLAGIRNDEIVLNSGPINVENTISSAIKANIEEAKSKSLEIIHQQNVRIPELIGDSDRLQQILKILISNSIKFTLENSTERSVTILSNWIKHNDNYGLLELTVCDHGIGIEKEYQEQMFLPFQQSDMTITRKYDGLGLGLALANDLVKLMGGSIETVSEMGSGSEFKISLIMEINKSHQQLLSYLEPQETEKQELNEDWLNEDILDQVRTMSILLVDDNLDALYTWVSMLDNLKIDVKAVSSGPEAISEITNNSKYSIIVLDIHMEGMNGIEVARKVREMKNINPIIIFVSTEFRTDILEKCKSAGGDAFIKKPLSSRNLVSKICNLVGIDTAIKGGIENFDLGIEWTPAIAMADNTNKALVTLITAAAINSFRALEDEVRMLIEIEPDKTYATLHSFNNLLSLIYAHNISSTVSELENIQTNDQGKLNSSFSKLNSQMTALIRTYKLWLKEEFTNNEMVDAQSIIDSLLGKNITQEELNCMTVKWAGTFIGELLERTADNSYGRNNERLNYSIARLVTALSIVIE